VRRHANRRDYQQLPGTGHQYRGRARHSEHSLRQRAGVVQCVTVQSQQTNPLGHRIVLQSGGASCVHPVVLNPGGQHCAAMVTVGLDGRFAYEVRIRKTPLLRDVAASAVNPGNLICDLLMFCIPKFVTRKLPFTSKFLSGCDRADPEVWLLHGCFWPHAQRNNPK